MVSLVTDDKFICFTLEKERYAIPLLKVKEVIGNIKITPVPQSPPYFKGIANLRDKVFSIIDLKKKLKLKTQDDGRSSTIIILDFASTSLGIVVDSVDSVATYKNEDLSDISEMNFSIDLNGVNGVAKVEDGLVIILNLENVLNINQIEEVKKIENREAA